MRFVSFNIHHGTVGRRGPVDLDQLGEVCAGFDADVIALQEVDQATLRVRGRDTTAVVGAACGMEPVFGRSQRMLGGRYGNGLLVRGTVLVTAVTRLPKVPSNRFWQEQRTLLEAEVVVAGRQLWVGSTHLAVKAWNNEPQLDRLLAHLATRPPPVVVLGDLNRTADQVAPQAHAAGFVLAEHGPTFPVHDPRVDIDHALVSPDLRVSSAEVRPTAMSDHAALVVDVVVGGDRQGPDRADGDARPSDPIAR